MMVLLKNTRFHIPLIEPNYVNATQEDRKQQVYTAFSYLSVLYFRSQSVHTSTLTYSYLVQYIVL